MTKISENIKRLRKSLGLTQTELAAALQITQQSITAYENGKKKPTLEKMKQMALLFSVSLDDLIGEQELNISVEKKTVHKNSRDAQMQKYFVQLKPEDQKAILKQVKLLAQNQKND